VREALLAGIGVLGFAWVSAVMVGILGGLLGLAHRQTWVGRVVRFCRAVFSFSP
jgi:hypothetical protein